MQLAFDKWHGCLNDFVVVWISDIDGDVVLGSLKRQAQKLCDRHAGIGADGLLVLQTRKPGELTPYRLTIVNSDGSLAKNCGNGVRCAALSVLKAHRERGRPEELPEMVELEVEGETLVARFLKTQGQYPLVAVEMGVPRLGSAVPWLGAAKAAVTRLAPELAADMGVFEIGNPHIVLTSDDASRDLMLRLGPALQKSDAWDGMNVHIVKSVPVTSKDQARAGNELGQPLAELYQAFVWERGAGETMACGSGACAVAALALDGGLVERDAWIGVDMPGGRLYVKHEQADEPVLLAGPGAFVFSGKVEL